MLEYIPGKYAHRPVEAAGFMFIHCIFVGFKKEYKGKGYASLLIDVCLKEAKLQGMRGVAVVTRKGAFMAKKDIFIKKEFVLVDEAAPDFELLVHKFSQEAPDPKFKNMKEQLKRYNKGLFVFRSVQCPYTEKNVNAILESAEHKFNLKPNLVDLEDAVAVQNAPCGFGAEIIAMVQEKVFDYLDAPMGRVHTLSAPSPYAPTLEEAIVLGEETISNAIRKIVHG